MSDVIYQPRGRAAEYADWAVNLYDGCVHRCAYCFSPLIRRKKREEFHADPKPYKNILERLERSARKHQGMVENVLLCFTSDPYQPESVPSVTREAIEILHRHDIGVTILSKGGQRSMADFDLLQPGRDVYATTLTTYKSNVWEPEAATTLDRGVAIVKAKEKGLETWVSFEPVIIPSDTLGLLAWVGPHIDHCKIGPLNYASQLPEHLQALIPKNIDWSAFAAEAQAICDRLGVTCYFKEDLRRLL